MKKTIHRLYKYRLLLALILFAGVCICKLPDPTAPAETILHFLAVVTAGLVIGYLWHNRSKAEKRDRQQRKAKMRVAA